jgi:Na+/H+ antiporter NhaD/arsenite permease-like protein
VVWRRFYPIFSLSLVAFILGYYIFITRDIGVLGAAFSDFVSFILLLVALYVICSGIVIELNIKASPLNNLLFLISGAILSNILGSIGASVLLIKPFIKMNDKRIKPYHIVFFIFLIGNIGGSLTPIGNPPLFIGYLKGIPFFWTLNLWQPWLVIMVVLSGIFLLYDVGNKIKADKIPNKPNAPAIKILGAYNLILLFIVAASLFLDSNTTHIPFLREIVIAVAGISSYFITSGNKRKYNSFNFESIREIVFLFAAIFFTLIPVINFIKEKAHGPGGIYLTQNDYLYWSSGTLSAFLDNAPTYLNLLTGLMSRLGMNIDNKSEVLILLKNHASAIMAISIGSVFFGGMTYIGNGPNFMVKSIAERSGVKMPSFIGYMLKFSIPVLLPALILVWILFFR